MDRILLLKNHSFKEPNWFSRENDGNALNDEFDELEKSYEFKFWPKFNGNPKKPVWNENSFKFPKLNSSIFSSFFTTLSTGLFNRHGQSSGGSTASFPSGFSFLDFEGCASGLIEAVGLFENKSLYDLISKQINKEIPGIHNENFIINYSAKLDDAKQKNLICDIRSPDFKILNAEEEIYAKIATYSDIWEIYCI
ncbi:hypothetical protein BpHYR1_044949 [Brachionus plicatilis]|uniref:Uncharacterized protein n=1 Tax=Brachionus plicatilis TaxID=10195 RepID=A0A3M7S0L9_BRAPC|nr:hypothetical protein BpHYR1_044949 [Brachionus plicatilis]